LFKKLNKSISAINETLPAKLQLVLFKQTRPFIKKAFIISGAGVIAGCSCGPDVSMELINTSTKNPELIKEREEVSKKVVVFFLIVNETKKDIRLKVLVDERELFIQDVPSQIKMKTCEAPPPDVYPAREEKVEVRKDARTLEVEEIYSERKGIFDITDFNKNVRGFRITIRKDGIYFYQDYLPSR